MTRTRVGIAYLVVICALAATVMTGPPAGAAGPFTTTDLGSLGAGPSQTTALNDGGQAVGWAVAAGGNTHAMSWRQGAR